MLFPLFQASAPPAQCAAPMNAWCASSVNCPNARTGPMVALHDTNAQGGSAQWRCYDPGTLDAATHSRYATGSDYCTRDAPLRNQLAHCLDPSVPTPAPPPSPPPPPYLSEVFRFGEAGVACIRIPSIIMAGDNAAAGGGDGGGGDGGGGGGGSPLLAFAECRSSTGDGCVPAGSSPSAAAAAPDQIAHVCMKRSEDGGATWSNITYPFGAPSTGAPLSTQPNAVWDGARQQVVLQNLQGDSNFQVVSKDLGKTWSAPVDIGAFLGRFRGIETGPGRGLALSQSGGAHAGRLLFIGHHGAYVEDAVWYSDDGGVTYNLSTSTFPKMDEAQLVELSDGSVMANMRNKHELEGDCRGVAVSNATEGGDVFGAIRPDAALISPVCMASIISVPPSAAHPVRALFFSNPATTSGRTHMTVRRSDDDGRSWAASQLVFSGGAAYSCLTRVPQGDNKVGLLWETTALGCSGPSCRMLFTVLPTNFTTVAARQE